MTVRNIKKNLAGAEDLLHGIGVETQSRGGAFYDMHKLDTYVPTYDVTEMQRSSLTFMRLYGTDTAYTDYRRNPTGTVGIPSDLGGVWEPMRSSELPVCGSFIYGAYVFSSDCIVGYNDGFMQWKGSLPKVVSAGATPATSGGIGAGAWVDRTDETLRGELIGARGDSNVTHTQYDSNINRTVTEKLNKYSSCEDYGATKTEYGYNPTVDALVVSDSEQDEDFLLPRHIGAAKDLYGVRRNACVISARANSGTGGFNTQVTSVSTTQDLANYGSVDNVTGFFDITSQPYKTWETVSAPTYYTDGFTATGLDFSGLKKGMVLRTLHAQPYYGFVTNVIGDRVYIAEWRKLGGASGETPSAGTGLVINPVDKLWALNCNVYMPAGSRTQNAAVAEFGLTNNNNATPTALNMFDLLILPQSTYGATSGFFVHSESSYSAKFSACFRGRNSDISGACFFADQDNYRGFWAVNSTFGFVYSAGSATGNKYAFSVKTNNNADTNDYRMAIDDLGRVLRLPERVAIATNGVALTLAAKRYINGRAASVTTALPSGASLQDGDIIKLHCTNPASGFWTVTATSILPHGGNSIVTSFTLTEGVYDAIYVGGTWYINK